MKTLCSLVAFWLGVALLPAQTDLPNRDSVPVGIDVTVEPLFPPSLFHRGTTKGQVTLLLVVDNQGTKRDHLIVDSTHPEFAAEVEKVVDRWDFTAARREGQRINAITRLHVNFEKSGAVISLGPHEVMRHIESLSTPSQKERLTRHIASPRQLDQIPEPVQVVQPLIPSTPGLHPDGVRIVYHFFIDQSGRVRLPHLNEDDVSFIEEDILNALYDAIVQWEFSPPTVNGEPVIVRASLPFRVSHSGHEATKRSRPNRL